MKKLREKNPPTPYILGWGQPSQNALVHSLNTSDKHQLVLLPQQNLLFSNRDQTTKEYAG